MERSPLGEALRRHVVTGQMSIETDELLVRSPCAHVADAKPAHGEVPWGRLYLRRKGDSSPGCWEEGLARGISCAGHAVLLAVTSLYTAHCGAHGAVTLVEY